jgi:hypothetical protein
MRKLNFLVSWVDFQEKPPCSRLLWEELSFSLGKFGLGWLSTSPHDNHCQRTANHCSRVGSQLLGTSSLSRDISSNGKHQGSAPPTHGFIGLYIIFLIDTGSPFTYLCHEAMEVLIGKDYHPPQSLYVKIHSERVIEARYQLQAEVRSLLEAALRVFTNCRLWSKKLLLS